MTLLSGTTERIRKHHDLACWLALFHASGIGPVIFRTLLDVFDSPAAVLTAIRQGPLPGQPDKTRRKLERSLMKPDWQAVERDLAWLESDPNHHILTWQDHAYPILLKEISDPPPLLFVHGDLAVLNTTQLAIVGSRNPTVTGQQTSEAFARELASLGLTITSGLALGIDAAAHRGALEAGGRTIAVLGCGLDRVYPRRHEALARSIIENGALVSELAPGSEPLPAHFPRRNRIISGLSVGTLVTEAALHSGSLITASQALEQGREVFAVPGSIHNPLARGCHQLLRQGAKLVQETSDIIEDITHLAALTTSRAGAKSRPSPVLNGVDPDYQKVIKTIGFEPTPVDVVVARTGMTVESLSSILLALEMNGVITSLPGGHYMRLANKETT